MDEQEFGRMLGRQEAMADKLNEIQQDQRDLEREFAVQRDLITEVRTRVAAIEATNIRILELLEKIHRSGSYPALPHPPQAVTPLMGTPIPSAASTEPWYATIVTHVFRTPWVPWLLTLLILAALVFVWLTGHFGRNASDLLPWTAKP